MEKLERRAKAEMKKRQIVMKIRGNIERKLVGKMMIG